MTRLFATLLVSLSLLLPGAASAQASGTIKPAEPAAAGGAPATAAAPAAAPAAGLSRVQSMDILQKEQIQRSQEQPGNLAPTWRGIKEGSDNYSSLPYAESSVLIQSKAQFPGQAKATTAGEAWRQYRNGPLTLYGGWLLVLTVIALAAMYFGRGQIKLHEPRTGRLIERFTSVERMAHWTVAISFVVLAISGLAMLFGKYVLLPIMGHTLFGWLAYACKNIHNFDGPVFTLSIIVFFVIYVKDNLPGKGDLKWLSRAGGMFGKKELPSGRFNAGEKIWFWAGVVVLGVVLSASGFVLDMLVPNLAYTRANMQLANIVHLVAAVLVVPMSLGHIYLGTIGMEGAYQSMRTGYVDDTWAREHHEYWYEDIASGRVPRVRSEEGAAVVGAPVRAS